MLVINTGVNYTDRYALSGKPLLIKLVNLKELDTLFHTLDISVWICHIRNGLDLLLCCGCVRVFALCRRILILVSRSCHIFRIFLSRLVACRFVRICILVLICFLVGIFTCICIDIPVLRFILRCLFTGHCIVLSVLVLFGTIGRLVLYLIFWLYDRIG